MAHARLGDLAPLIRPRAGKHAAVELRAVLRGKNHGYLRGGLDALAALYGQEGHEQ